MKYLFITLIFVGTAFADQHEDDVIIPVDPNRTCEQELSDYDEAYTSVVAVLIDLQKQHVKLKRRNQRLKAKIKSLRN